MTTNPEHILLAYGFDGKGGAEALFGDAVSETIKSKKLGWLHLDVNSPGTKKWLKAEVPYLNKHIIEALLEEETRPRMTQFDDGILLILRGVNLNKGADPEDMISIRLWVDKQRIISLQRRQLQAVFDIKKKLEKGTGPKNAGAFVTTLSSLLLKKMEPVLTELDDETDVTEEKVIDNPDNSLRKEIVEIRKTAILLRRYIAPQREVISQLRMSDISWFKESDQRQLQENYNLLTRYVEDLDAIRERAQIVKDELANILADKLNKNMYILSVIAAIFLPLGFLTGLLGINIGGIPGAENPDAFWFFCIVMTTIVIAQIILFKKMKWF